MINKIKVGYRTFELHTVDPDLPAKFSHSTGETHLRRDKRGRIFVDQVEDKVEEMNTLIHEILHAIWDVYHVEEGVGEERVVNTLANGLTNVFVDNPRLMEYLGVLHGTVIDEVAVVEIERDTQE